MTFIRRSGGQITLFVLSLLGVAISIYLTAVHYENVPLVCSASGFVDCASVLSSPYSVVPGTTIPITVPGLVWCLVSASLAFIAWRVWPERRSIHIAQFAWALVGMLTVLYLVFVELVRLHRLCAWCTALHVIILVMLLMTVVNLQGPEPAEEFEVEEEQPVAAAKRDR
ncbi:MAG TPA: vitamin K epoxide reductase family protein [Ktedonobacteraceae bacterium]|nr:vitamin K epoxide reductase family protein [Ktedonobacteraceae bacterium]